MPIGAGEDASQLGADAPSATGAVAAIDCGTNSTRLLVLGATGQPLVRLMEVTRLGDRVDATGRLSEEAISRTLRSLEHYRAVMDSHGVVRARATATSAARDARNAEEFFDRAEEVLGVRPVLLSGHDEGELSFAGAARGLPAGLPAVEGDPLIVVDVGGGSTELVLGTREAGASRVRSVPVGCVRVSERFFRHDPPWPAELVAARREVDARLEGAVRDLGLGPLGPGGGVSSPTARAGAGALAEGTAGTARAGAAPVAVVGTAGTVTSLAALDLALDTYDPNRVHGHWLASATVREWLERLAGEPPEARASHAGLAPARVPTIVGGALVVESVLRALGAPGLVVSESDILDGLAQQLLAELRAGGHPDG